MYAAGLAKLLEELGELSQIAAKKLAYPNTDDHPDGAGSMRLRLEDEIGDVLAAIDFVSGKFRLNARRILDRKAEKLGRFREWDGQP